MKIEIMKNTLLAVSIFAFSAFGQEKLALNDAITIALENNYDLKIRQADEKVAGISNSWGAAGSYPSINFSVASNNIWDYNDNADFTQERLTGGATLNWLLFDGFAVWIRKDKLELYEELSAGNTMIVIENTVQSVILSYYKVLLEFEKVHVAETLKNLSYDRFDNESQRQQIGTLTTYDLLQAKNSWLEDQGRFLMQEVVYKNAIRDLNYLMAEPPDRTWDFIEDFGVQPKIFSVDSLNQKMISNNSTLKNQYLNQSLLQKEVSLKRSEWWPSLTLNGGYSDVSNRLSPDGAPSSTQDSYNYNATLNLSWSLFNGGNRKRAIEIAKIDRETGDIEIENMKHALTNQLYNYHEIHLVRRELLDVAEEALETAQLNLNISEEKFRSGAINSFNYRDVQLLYLNAAVNRLDAIYAYIDVEAALMRLTGGIISQYEE
jgi:outer membrane protein